MKNRKASRCRLLRLLSVLGLLSAAFLLCLLGSCRNAASDSDTETRSDAATGTATEPTTAATGSATDQNNTETDTAPEQTTAAGETVEPEIRLDTVTDVTLPDSSTEFSWTLAKQLLGLCTGNTREGSTQRFEKAGFKAILHKNYDKPDEDPSHTSAYSVGQKTMTWGGRERTVLLVSIRGTNAGEWYSNADIVPSRDPNTAFAENFYLAAQDIYEGLKSVLATVQYPVILVSGHSRGAACANLLGVLLNADRGTKDVFVYTFASPNTVRKTPDVDCSNIFNIINPCDPVTVTPVASLGFFRAGKDITLPGNAETIAKLKTLADAIGALSPTITSYYEDKHSLTGPGLSADGLSAYDLSRALADMFIQATKPGGNGTPLDLSQLLSVPEDSDFYPFVQVVSSLYVSGDMSKLFGHHMPEVYLSLMLTAERKA